MVIRQEDETPIGNLFHQTKIRPLFERIEGQVDEFSVDTDKLTFEIDELITKLKSLKNQVKTSEKEFEKKERSKALKDALNECDDI